MKHNEMVRMIVSRDTNEGIILIRNGLFVEAIGRDALLLNRIAALKLYCQDNKACKAAFPAGLLIKYLELIENYGYSYKFYDYEKSGFKNLILKREYEGNVNPIKENTEDCTNCKYYKNCMSYANLDIDELLRQKEEKESMYWHIGNIILENSKLGNKFITNVSIDLKMEFPNIQGFSERNLKYMRKFAEEYKDFEFVQEVLAQITWYHNVILLDKIKNIEERKWYIKK